MVTFALAMVAPEGSFTKPEIVPRSDCANRDAETIKLIKHTKTATRQIFIIGRLLVMTQSFSPWQPPRGYERWHYQYVAVPSPLGERSIKFFGLRVTALAGTLPQIPRERNQVFYEYWNPTMTIRIDRSEASGSILLLQASPLAAPHQA